MRNECAMVMMILGLAGPLSAQPRVILTEIMYNPASQERAGETEWVEIANVGNEIIEITNWKLDDEDQNKWGAFSCALAPGEVAVLINGDAVKPEQFRAAWDVLPESAESVEKLNYQVIPVKWGNLANAPSDENENLKLLNEKGEVVCEVNIQDRGDWPSCRNPDGPSIWLSDLKAVDLNEGRVWKRSVVGQDGARKNSKTDLFDGEDIGSPGFVPGVAAKNNEEKNTEDKP